MGVDEALVEASEAVDSLAVRTVLPADDETLTRRLLTAHRAAQQLLGVVLALVHQIDAAGVAGRAGAPTTTAWLRQRLNVTAGHTTSDGKLTLEFAECLGACEQAPCILINDVCFGDLTEETALKAIESK